MNNQTNSLTIPPLPDIATLDYKKVDLSITLGQQNSDDLLTIKFDDEGGGKYVKLSTYGEFPLDAPELIELVDWINTVCQRLDTFEEQ